MTSITDKDYSVSALTKQANLHPDRIREFIAREDDPLPTLLYFNSKQRRYKVQWSIWAEWSERNFGLSGTHRGTIESHQQGKFK